MWHLLRNVMVAILVTLPLTSQPAAAAPTAGEHQPTTVDDEALVRTDVQVPGADGMSIGVREVRSRRATQDRPVLLIHGARVPGIPSFDLPVEGGSLAGDLARAGHRVLIVDARGYGASTRPAAMSQPPEESLPLTTGDQVVRDIEAVVDWLDEPSVDIVGWATGGHWPAWYASGHPTLGRGSSYEDPERPGEFDDAIGGYRLATGPSLMPSWDNSIPGEDKSQWRDPKVAEIYQREALASDPTSAQRTPPSFRAPTGALKDSFYLATGRNLWDADAITARTLVLRSEYDFWSRPEDVSTLVRDLDNARSVRAVTLRHATHYAHLDRTNRGCGQFLAEVKSWLAGP